jgi:hypothetical protein
MSKPLSTFWIWTLGLAFGLACGVLYLGLSPAVANDDDVIVYQVDLTGGLSQADIDELVQVAQENEGRDIILKPAPGFEVDASETRRARDEERAAAEEAEMREKVDQGLAEGLYVTGSAERPSCVERARLTKQATTPGRHLLCDGNVVTAPSRLAYERSANLAGVEDLLRQRMVDLLDGPSAEEKALGYSSPFSNAAALQSLELDETGLVAVDFASIIGDQVGDLHTGYATHTMLQQVFRTLFQFRDVRAVRLTLDGDCQAFGDLIGGPCQELDRALFEQMLLENRETVRYFNLKQSR